MVAIIYFCLQIIASLGKEPSSGGGIRVERGHLPVVLADERGGIHLTFGQDSTIYYATYNAQLASFEQPVAVAVLPNLVAGAKRGPQVAVSDQAIVITAVNKAGDIHAYPLNRLTGKWSSGVRVNDVPEIAKEGFQAVTGTGKNTFHAVWLDLRGDKKNKIVGATSHDGGLTWTQNKIIYQSPDGSVCECCKVSVKARNNDVYVQFRNWLDGSRDLYLAYSADGGVNYALPQKLGTGTWKLKACPMDGGAIVLTGKGKPLTVWRRENSLYRCVPGEPEQLLATGRNVTAAAGAKASVIAWDDNGTIWAKRDQETPIAVGKGMMPSVAVTKQIALVAWESDGQVMVEKIP